MLGGKKAKADYPSTIEGDPLAYTGDHPLVIAVWSDWASLWKAATEPVVSSLQVEFGGRCEFVYVECRDAKIREQYKVDIVPVVLVYHRGVELARFPNVMVGDEVRKAIEAALA